jgi:antitoxin component of MazEF toxin-antitoxin module
MIRKLLRIGNSVGITLDKRMLRDLGLDGVTWIKIELDKNGKRIIVSKRLEGEY